MSTTELNHFLSSFERPSNFTSEAWSEILTQAKSVWNAHLHGHNWNDQVDIKCKESYLMLVDSNGKLIIQNESLLNYVKNKHVRSWRERLEEIGFKAIRDKQYEKADRYFTKAIKVDESRAMNFYRRALIRMKLQRHKKALEDVSKSIELKPNEYVFYLKRAQLYRILDIDYKVMNDLNMAVRLKPNSANVFDIRGKFRLSLGDRAGGKMDLLKAEELREKGLGGDSELYGTRAA